MVLALVAGLGAGTASAEDPGYEQRVIASALKPSITVPGGRAAEIAAANAAWSASAGIPTTAASIAGIASSG